MVTRRMESDPIQRLRDMAGNHDNYHHLEMAEPKSMPELYDFMGNTTQEQINFLGEKIFRVEDMGYLESRHDVFTGVIKFLLKSTVQADHRDMTGRGINLARMPFLSPSMPESPGKFSQTGQFRWDTYWHNYIYILLGMKDMAWGQLENIADVYSDYGRAPNALSADFLSHAQPPLEAVSAFELIENGLIDVHAFDKIINFIEHELNNFWWDRFNTRANPKQSADMRDARIRLNIFSDTLTRHNSIHFDPLLVGCEDGEDHTSLTIAIGEDLISVKLNSIIYRNLVLLSDYYAIKMTDKNIPEELQTRYKFKSEGYKAHAELLKKSINQIFWENEDEWRGFRSYSLKHRRTIKSDRLSDEVTPLWSRIATDEQAEVIRQNLRNHYSCKNGLSNTARKGEVTSENFPILEAIPDKKLQWNDNVWAPTIDFAVSGLLNYSQSKGDIFYEDAMNYAAKFVNWAERAFRKYGAFPEKAPKNDSVMVNGGLYGELLGFGWTIAVYLKFIKILSQNNELNRLDL
jgi:neutral trehalase